MNITQHLQTPAVDSLCDVFGPRWEHMPRADRLAILMSLATAAYCADDSGVSERLDILAEDISGHDFQDAQISPLLCQLDGELETVEQALALIGGIALCAQ
ncbi:MAG: hypothetical protein AAF921_02635 [Cyanobacteria bacterium P01_D01_bin.44]